VKNNPWRYSFASVVGTYHGNLGQPCQDSSFCDVIFDVQNEPILLAIASDGAGSAKFAEESAKLICKTILEQSTLFFQQGGNFQDISKETIFTWISYFNHKVALEAESRKVSLHEFACTLLIAILGLNQAIFAQVGDGAIVVGDHSTPEEYSYMFWPEKGEYENETVFVTEKSALERIQFVQSPYKFDEIALFTDGIQRLVLNYMSQTVHIPFFKQMFARIPYEGIGRLPEFDLFLEKYLSSPQINSRTNDDRTLIIATRKISLDLEPKKPPTQIVTLSQYKNTDTNILPN
jgi:hypothetical protein